METGIADLHMHSYFSDGALSPFDLARECLNSGITVAALTDHETTMGLEEFKRAANMLKISFIPGIEISMDFEGNEHHLLGYLPDIIIPGLNIFLEQWRLARIEQVKSMALKLQNVGFVLSFEDVLSQAHGQVQRSHLGYAIFANQGNKKLLLDLKIRTTSDFFREFLKDDGSSSVFVKRELPPARKVIEKLKEVGAMAIWAHPFWRDHNPENIERRAEILRNFGLDGIEICYPFHDKEKTFVLHRIAKKLLLKETSGSDFHSVKMDMLNKLAGFEKFGFVLDFQWLERFWR